VEDILFIISLSQEGESTAQLAHRVLLGASSTYPQLAKVRLLQMPTQRSVIQTWSACLAVEVVDQWLDDSTVGISVDSAVAKLSLAETEAETSLLLIALNTGPTGASLMSELASQIESMRDDYSQIKNSQIKEQKWLEQEHNKLSSWFSPPLSSVSSEKSTLVGLQQIQFNARALQSKNQVYLREILISWRQAGLHSTLLFLRALGERLTHLYEKYDRQRQMFKGKETSAWRAFDNLSVLLAQLSFSHRKRQVTFETVLQALSKAYSFKLEAEIYAQACQLVGKLKQEVYLLASNFVQSDGFLNELKRDFMQNSPSESLLKPLLRQSLTQNMDVLRLRREIESMFNRPAYLWGSLRQSQKAIIRQQILSQLGPLCLEVYAQCCASAINLQTPNSQPESAADNLEPPSTVEYLLQGSEKLDESSFIQGKDVSQELEDREHSQQQFIE
jgi:hypothetical protein